MAEEERIRRLEGRIEELENQLGGKGRRDVAELSPEELAAYQKVRDVLAVDYGEFCGINDCFRCRVCVAVCQICVVCRVCRVCDVECSCGPCMVGGPGGGVSRFSAFGG